VRTKKIDSITIIEEEIYPIYDCSCFFFFEFYVNNISKKPSSIQVYSVIDQKQWFEPPLEYFEIEETIIELK